MPRDPAKYPFDDRIRTEHMLQAARQTVRFIAGRSRTDLDSDDMFRRAMVNALQEIGEAASRMSPAGRARLADVPWDQVIGMRHRLVHGYDAINLDMVWKVATEELAPLIAALETATKDWPLPEAPRR